MPAIGCRGEPGLVGLGNLIGIDARAGQHSGRIGKLSGQPGHRVGRQLGDEVPASGLPAVELRVVMGGTSMSRSSCIAV